MHDPMVVAFTIRRPWPEIRRPHGTNPPRWKWRRWSSFAHVAGWELYFPSLITVWHVEPHGYDAFTVCKHKSHWQWHVHHWHIQWCFLQHWRRRLLTRCAWCHGRSTKRDAVNVSHQWDHARVPWWKGETHLFHHDCSTVAHAHRICLCDDPLFEHNRDYGQCLMCGKFRGWKQTPGKATRTLAAMPVGARMPADEIKALFDEERP
ncbi:hypothetical protein [Rhodococcus koreensis]